MREKIIVAYRQLPCDLCGQLIRKGEKCRMLRDDTQPELVYFEHIICPTGHAVVNANHPVYPIQTNKNAAVMA